MPHRLQVKQLELLRALPTPLDRPRLFPDNIDMIKSGLYPRTIGIGTQKAGSGSLFLYQSSVKHFMKSVVKVRA